MRINKPTEQRVEPNRPNRPKSVHSRGGGQEGYVRMRHPEYHLTPEETVDALVAGVGATEQPCDCPPGSDTIDYVVDDFRRTVITNTYSPGGPALTITGQYQGTQIQGHMPPFDVGPFTIVYTPGMVLTSSYKGSWYAPHTTRPPNTCKGLSNYFNGWRENEAWARYLVTAKPDNVAGLTISNIRAASGYGVMPTYGVAIRVSSTTPAAIRAGTLVGTIPSGGTSGAIFIPANLIPEEGQYFWIGMTPNWICDHDSAHYACGWNWPYNTGVWNSGGMGRRAWPFHIGPSITWQIWDSDVNDFGNPTNGDDAGAWWGDLPGWQVAWDGGVASVNGNSMCFVVSSGGQGTLTATLPGDISPDDADDADYDVPWDAEEGINVKVRFKLTTAGSLTEAGVREFSFGWHDSRDLTIGKVYFGDTGHAQGLGLFNDDVESAFVAKDIVEGEWHWIRIDTRHPTETRMKLWQEVYAGAEPVAWDIRSPSLDEADRPTSDSYLQMVMKLGNETGPDQTLCVDKIVMAGAGLAYHWVEDYLGDGDGSTSVFHTAQPFIEGTFSLFVDGLFTRCLTTDIDVGEFTARQKYPSAALARMVARYVVAPLPDDV